MQNLKTILDWVRYATSELSRHPVHLGHGCDNALDEAVALVLGALHLPFALSVDYFGAHLTEAEKALLRELLTRRIEERVPTPYLTKRAPFGGLEFYIDERALIPRSPLLEVIERRLSPYWDPEREPEAILDLCCGSGCLGLVAKMVAPEAKVVLADLSEEALAVARENLRRFELEDEVTLVQSDGFAGLSGRFDWILCNPPYVDAEEMAQLPEEYRHEPTLALASGADGMDFVRGLLARAAEFLNPKGVLVFEVGMSGFALEEAFPEVDFPWVELERGGVGVVAMTREELCQAFGA